MSENLVSSVASDGSKTWFQWFKRWKPTSMEQLVESEVKMLSTTRCELVGYFVPVFTNCNIWTVVANQSDSKRIPIVMVHGFGGGIGLWSRNYDVLSKSRSVFAFDILGFGRSTRCPFSKSPNEIEEKFVNSIEEWRNAVSIDEMHLLGHSFGGYLAASYALKYPSRVKSLILADPWGFPTCETEEGKSSVFSRWCKMAIRVLQPFNPFSSQKTSTPWNSSQWIEDTVRVGSIINPLSVIRLVGPWGPNLLKKTRQDFVFRFPEVTEKHNDAVLDYLYHCNAQPPTGETAFKRINHNLGFSHNPMLSRIGGLKENIPVTFIYGLNSWISAESGYQTKSLLPHNYVSVHCIEGAGHHLYADNPVEFNKIVKNSCSEAEK